MDYSEIEAVRRAAEYAFAQNAREQRERERQRQGSQNRNAVHAWADRDIATIAEAALRLQRDAQK